MAIFANTIDGNDIYAKRAEQDKDGNPIRSVPSPGVNEHRGEVLTVSNSDEVVWAPASGGGGGGYTPVTITPEQSAVSGSTLIVNLQNHTLVTLDLSNIDPTAGGQYSIEEISLIAPEVASGDYTDIIVQIKPYNDTDGIKPIAYVMESGEPVKLVPTAFMGNSYAKDIWICVHIIGRMYIRYDEDSDAS